MPLTNVKQNQLLVQISDEGVVQKRLFQRRQSRLLFLVEAFEALGFGGEGVERFHDDVLSGMRSHSDDQNSRFNSGRCFVTLDTWTIPLIKNPSSKETNERLA